MKKILLLGMLIMSLFSCSKDDSTEEIDRRPDLIIGKWKLTEEFQTYTGLGYAFIDHWEEVYGDLVLTINSNGTCNVSGACVTKYNPIGDLIMDMSVDFWDYYKWEWNGDKNEKYPLKLYYINHNASDISEDWNFKVTFNGDDNLELKNGLGYKFQRIK